MHAPAPVRGRVERLVGEPLQHNLWQAICRWSRWTRKFDDLLGTSHNCVNIDTPVFRERVGRTADLPETSLVFLVTCGQRSFCQSSFHDLLGTLRGTTRPPHCASRSWCQIHSQHRGMQPTQWSTSSFGATRSGRMPPLPHYRVPRAKVRLPQCHYGI